MKNPILLAIFSVTLLLVSVNLSAQVGINTDGTPPDNSAMLDVKSSTKGLLAPRVSLLSITSANPVETPAVGLLVYNTANAGTAPNNVMPGYYRWNGIRWTPIEAPQGINIGDMLYWNGTQWVGVPAGTKGQVLTFNDSVPSWSETSAQMPTLSTETVSGITPVKATTGGNVNDGGSLVTERGICWGTSPDPTISDNKVVSGTGTGSFSTILQGLAPNTTYYIRAYATNGVGTGYGNGRSFSSQSGVIVITTSALSGITAGSAITGGEILDDGGEPVTARGVCWSTASSPTIADNFTTDSLGIGTYISNITGLLANTTYFVRAYGTNSINTFYGDELTFTSSPNPVAPTVITTMPTNIDQANAVSGGTVTSGGGALVIARGVCWSTSQNPTLSNNFTDDGTGMGLFVSNLAGLTANTLYYLRAYAVNSNGTAFGDEISFITQPSVTTSVSTNITQTTAISGGEVSGGNAVTISARGVCWSSSANPTIANNHTTDGTGFGVFSSSITGLATNTTYHIRAYAINSVGAAYGNQETITTLSNPVVLTVTTNSVTNVASTNATCGGNVLADGGSPVVSRGVCWSTNPGPSIADSHTTDGAGTGSFVSNLTNLTANTLYFVRSYATNGSETAYGNELSFTTNCSSYANVSVAITPSENPVCPGALVSFSATPTNGGTQPLYQWKVNSVNIAGATGSTFSYAPANNDAVTCMLTSNAQCISGNPATSNTVTMNVTAVVPVSISISASLNPICTGANVTFTATPTNGGLAPTYQWNVNGTIINGATNVSYAYSPGNSDAVTCTMTSNATCAVGTKAASNALTMTVNPNLSVSVSIATTTNPVCSGTSVSFTATPINGGTLPGYQWKVNGINAIGATNSSYTFIPLDLDAVTCQLTSNEMCAEGNPAISNALTMTVNQNLPVSVLIAASANPVCEGATVTATATPTNGGLSPVYQWKINGLNANGATNATYSYIPTNNDVITCSLTSTALCAIGSPALSNPVTMTVNPNLPVSVSISASANPICAGTSVSFTAIPVNGGLLPLYQWKLNGTNVDAATNAIYTYIPSNNDALTCSLTSSSVCTTGNPAISNTVTMTVNPILTAGASIVASANPFTPGSLVTFTATATNGGITPVYQWKRNGVIIGTNSNTYTYIPSDGDNLVCNVTSNATCVTGNPAASNTITMAVDPLYATVVTTAASNIGQTIATTGGNITADGGSAVSFRGVCWSTSQNPTLSNSYTTDGSGNGTFVSNLTGLTSNTLYFIRAYAVNSTGTAYGNEIAFSTLPTIITDDISNITQTTAISGGNITTGGGVSVLARGVCWSTFSNPTFADSHTSNGTGTGSFSSNLTGLTGNTVYFVRAYATNQSGIAYGNQKTFTTSPFLATVATTPVSLITLTTATSGGNITFDGGGYVTVRGVCWSTLPNPTINNSKTTDGVGAGTFSSNLTGLTGNTLYYLRAYATNSAGTAYGNEVSFTTQQSIVPPTITTTAVSGIFGIYAYSGGNVLTDGGAPVIFRGVCWSTSPSPTVADNHSTDGNGIGTFVSNIINLTPTTQYYVRAYAINSSGTAYGNEQVFTTIAAIPCPGIPTVTYGGQVYNTVQIGTQCWFKENLNYPTANSKCYNNNPVNCQIYGSLYSGGIDACPTGWHLPSSAEWEVLAANLGGDDVAGGKMKETGFSHWNTPNTGATNTSGFSALGSGMGSSGFFFSLNAVAYFWTSTIYYSPDIDATVQDIWSMSYNRERFVGGYTDEMPLYSYSIRCLKN